MKYNNIWCCRKEMRWFAVSYVIDDKAWLIYLFGKPFWIGKNKPGFLK